MIKKDKQKKRSVSVRLPKHLSDKIEELARKNYRTLNAEIIYRLEIALGKEEKSEEDRK